MARGQSKALRKERRAKGALQAFSALFGGPAWQVIHRIIHRLSLAGMNYGGGSDFSRSGEVAVLSYISRYLNATSPEAEHVMFDVGAHEGEYSLRALGSGIANLRLFAFEPSRTTFVRLQQTLTNHPEVELENFALGSADETGVLYRYSSGSGLASLVGRRLSHFGVEMSEPETVQIRSLESYCREKQIEQISFLKLDVEGKELDILGAAQRLVKNQTIDFIQFEFGSAHIDSREFFQDFWYLLEPHYRIFRILHRGLVEIDKYRETLEVFLPTNYLAVARNLPAPPPDLRASDGRSKGSTRP